MGKPESTDDFQEFDIIGYPDMKVYVAKSVLKDFVKDDNILASLEGYGRYYIEIK